MLPDKPILIEQTLIESAKIRNIKCDIFGDFQTLCFCVLHYKYFINSVFLEPNGFLTTIMNIFGQICLSASVFMIISISLERRFAVCQPHVYRIHIKTTPLWKHLGLYLGPVLTAAVLLNLPYFLNAFVSPFSFLSFGLF